MFPSYNRRLSVWLRGDGFIIIETNISFRALLGAANI